MASNTTPSSAAHPSLDPRPRKPAVPSPAALAQGTVPPEKEIETRGACEPAYTRVWRGAQRNPQHLRDAIEYSEAVLWRLPRDSPKRPQHLTRLSYVCMSEYAPSRSRRAIDEAVRCGRLAREEAVATGLPERYLGLYCEILNNVGVALSHRCRDAPATPAAAQMEAGMREDSSSGSSSAADDLDEAIECAREVKTRSTRESADYSTTLLNLASRLTRRYSMRGDPADHAEAVELLQELQSLSPPGSVKSGLAIMQLRQMAVNKFIKTDAVEDLGEALE
jgi:hypothetical protein